MRTCGSCAGARSRSLGGDVRSRAKVAGSNRILPVTGEGSSMNGRVSTTTVGDRLVYHLHDEETGASASILPSYGFNLFDLRLPIGGAVRPVVASEQGWAEAPSR